MPLQIQTRVDTSADVFVGALGIPSRNRGLCHVRRDGDSVGG